MTNRLGTLLRRLAGDTAGSVVIETALVAPVLVLLGLGAFDISRMVARQTDLQAGSTDVQGIVLAVANSSATDPTMIKNVLMNSLSLSSSQVSVIKVYRCNTTTALTTTNSGCTNSGDVVSTYYQITLTDTYNPTWTKFGVGSAVTYSVVRTVQIT